MSITTIVLSASSSSVFVEAIAGEAGILPGHLLEVNTSGEFVRCSTSGAMVMPRIAVEDTTSGKGVNDAYALGDIVYARILRLGDTCLVMLQAGETVTMGSILESNGGTNPGELKLSASEFTNIFNSLEDKTTVSAELCRTEATL